MAIAVAVLSADGMPPKESLAGTVFLGELGLDGRIRAVPGVLPSTAAAVAAGFERVVVPVENAAEAALVPAVRVVAAPTLSGLIGWLRAGGPVAPGWGVRVVDSGAGMTAPAPDGATGSSNGDLAGVVGQPVARRAAEICAAGGHHMMLLGPPGTGKTMPAERLPARFTHWIFVPLAWLKSGVCAAARRAKPRANGHLPPRNTEQRPANIAAGQRVPGNARRHQAAELTRLTTEGSLVRTQLRPLSDLRKRHRVAR